MADENIRIVVEAVDLASEKLRQIARDVLRNTEDMRRTTEGYANETDRASQNTERFTNLLSRLGGQQRQLNQQTGQTSEGLQRFARSKDQAAESGNRLSAALLLIARGMQAVESGMSRLDPSFARHQRQLQLSERSTSDWGTSLQRTGQILHEFGRVVDDTTNLLGDHDRELKSKKEDTDRWNASLMNMGRTVTQFHNLLDRFTGSLREHDRHLESVSQRYQGFNRQLQLTSGGIQEIESGFSRMDDSVRRTGDGMWNFTRSMEGANREKEKLDRNVGTDHPAAQQKMQRSLLRTIGSVLQFTGSLAAAAAGTFAVGNAVGSLTAGAIGLAGALSSLVGVAEVVPAAFTAIAGSLAAVTTIFKPAIDQVQQYLTAVNKATNDPTATTAAGPSNIAQARQQAAQQIGDAERSLQRARVDAAMQMQDLERRLYELRIQNTQQVADAERAVRQAELSGLQQIIAAEERLHQLRMQDRAQETQLEAALANAQASARGEAARGGASQAVAEAAVQQAQDTLDQFRQQASGNEAVAQGQVTGARQTRAQNVADAQRSLQRTIQDNAQQVQDLERQIAEQRLQNVRQVADAERALARARVQGAQQVAQAQASANTQMATANAILAKMTPLQRELALSIEHIVTRWKELTAPARNRFLELAIDLVNRVNQHLPQLASLVSHYANVITGIGRGVMNQIFQPQEFRRVTGFANQQATNLGIVGQGGEAALQGIITVATSRGGEEFLRWLAEAVRNFGRLLDHLAHLQNHRDGFIGFFNAAHRTVKQVAEIFWNLGGAIVNILEVGFKPGSGFLQGIVQLTKHFDNWTKSQHGKDSLREFLLTGFQSLHQWGRLLAPFAKVVGDLVVQMTAWTPLMKIIADIIDGLVTTPILGNFVGLIAAFAASMVAVGAVLPGNQRTLSRMAGILGDVAGKMGKLAFAALQAGGFLEFEGSAAGFVASVMGAEFAFSIGAAGIAFEGFGASVTIGMLPLLAIVGAVVAVVAIFAVLYLKWQPFHHLVNVIAGAIKDVLIGAFHLLERAMGFLTDHWQAMFVILGGPVGIFVVFIYNHFNTIKDFLVGIFDDLKQILPGVWHTIWSVMKDDPFIAAFMAIGGQIEDHWTAIWHKIYNVARDVWDEFAKGINFILKIVGSTDSLPPMPALGGQSAPATHPQGGPGRFHGRGPNLQGAAMGGRFQDVPGGMIHIVEAGAPEYVISTDPKYRARSLQLIIDALNELGVPIPRFQHGGRASAAPPTTAIKALPGTDLSDLTPALKFLGAFVSEHGGLVTSAVRNEPGSYHSTGQAIDIAAPGYNSPWLWSFLHQRSRGFAEQFGPTFMPGGGGLFHYGVQFSDPALQAQHQNHIHNAFLGTLAQITTLLQGGGNGGILGSILGAINPVNALHWVEDHIPGFGSIGSRFGKMGGYLQDAGGWVRDKFIGWIRKTPGLLATIAEHLGSSILGAVTSIFSNADIANELSRGQARALASVSGTGPDANQLRARLLAQGLYGWGADQFAALVPLWNQESGWRADAVNRSSNAQGIPQLLPSQHPGPHPGFPSWPPIDPVQQILWGLAYIHGRKDERDPKGAWAHEQRYGWYDFGGEVMSPLGTAMPAIVHGGEWIINRMQQMRLAQIFGSWDRAKTYLFTSQAPSYGSLFPHQVGAQQAPARGGVNQTFVLNEVQPNTDINYVMRMAEIHMRSHA